MWKSRSSPSVRQHAGALAKLSEDDDKKFDKLSQLTFNYTTYARL